MAGFITRTEVIANARLIVELYGFAVLMACLNAKEGETFLAIVVKHQQKG